MRIACPARTGVYFDGANGPCPVSETGAHFCTRPLLHDEVPDQRASERMDHTCICTRVWGSLMGGHAELDRMIADNRKARG